MKTPEWIPLCNEKQLEELIKREKEIYSDHDFTQQLYSSEKGAYLYNLVWKPLEKELRDVKTVYYSPSGILYQISFAAIPAGNYLLSDKYDLRLVSSTREILRLKNDKQAKLPQGSAAVYGGLYYDIRNDSLMITASRSADMTDYSITQKQELGVRQIFLKETVTEAESICQYLTDRKIPVKLYSRRDGNEESFKQLSGTSTGIIHLATHGFFMENIEIKNNSILQPGGITSKEFQNPLLRSGLLLGGSNRAWTGENVIEGIEDGILTAEEISHLNLIKTQLVVLSACQTGLGEVKGSEGVFGLQRAFKLAGVETLVMSLWRVQDDATQELMSVFYQQWLSGKTKYEAFANAQKYVREKYKDPFFWAGFVMMD